MDKLIKYVETLLFTQDCVVIPELGAFVATKKNATIKDGYILPRRKELGFNPKLNNNDGLLAQYIATQENIRFAKALDQLLALTKQIHAALDRGQSINWDSIGQMRKNEMGAIIFEPNPHSFFLPETFGLEQIKLLPTIPHVENNKKNNKVALVPQPSIVSEDRSKARPIKYWLTAAAASITLFLLSPKPAIDTSIQHAGILPYAITINEVAPTQKLAADNSPSLDYLKHEANKPFTYHVIVASCSSRQQALQHKALLARRGLKQIEIIYGGENRFRLSAQRSSDKELAQITLASINEKYPRIKDAWILRRRN